MISLFNFQTGCTGLHYAAQGNHLEMFKLFLFEYKLNRDLQNKIGKTALHLAVQEGNQQIVEILLGQNCELDLFDMVRN